MALDRGGGRLGAGLAALLFRRSDAGGLGRLARLARGRCVRNGRCFVVHRTIENRRLQRTAVGQRQNIQACSPSAMEKKIICARPTMFSNGTNPTCDCTRLSVELSRLSPIMKKFPGG